MEQECQGSNANRVNDFNRIEKMLRERKKRWHAFRPSLERELQFRQGYHLRRFSEFEDVDLPEDQKTMCELRIPSHKFLVRRNPRKRCYLNLKK